METPLEQFSRSRKDCCKVEEHLILTQETSDFSYKQCMVCGCKHYELVVDPMHFKLMGKFV